MKKQLTKKLNALSGVIFKAFVACCLLILLQSSKSIAQIYAKVVLTDPHRSIGPNVIYDYCTATITLSDVAPSGGIDIYVNDSVDGTTNVCIPGVSTYVVHVDAGHTTADLGSDEILHYWSFDDFIDGENYGLNGQYTSHLSVTEDPINSSSYISEDSEYDFTYDFQGYVGGPGPITW